jgi:glycerol-1-phosphate dehydrogenase [NAD(P)+]
MQELSSTLTLDKCLNQTFSCSCGQMHRAALKAAFISKDALDRMPEWLKKNQYKKIYLICDNVTVSIAGEKVRDLLTSSGLEVHMHVISHLSYDESTLGELLIHENSDCDVVVGVGTGSINDMCRYFSFKLQLPYCIVATAAPMDGFASSISALTVNHLKTTFEVRTPQLIVGDTEILKGAPYSMISAGLGDLIGKFTCLCDWKLSRLINGEYYCETITEMVSTCARKVLDNAGSVKERDPQVLGDIMEGLVFTGVAMSMVGNSRPASGCEHHISHYWEMIFEQQGRRPAPHGHQVGVGTILILKLTEALRKRDKIDFDRARREAEQYDFAQWSQEIRRAYGPAAQGVIELEQDAGKNETGGRLKRINKLEENWKKVVGLLESLPPSQTVTKLMEELSAPCCPSQIGVDRQLLKDTLLYCKEVRARYTILQMLWDLGLLQELTEEIMKEMDT